MASFHQHLVNQGCRLAAADLWWLQSCRTVWHFGWFDWEHLELEKADPLGSEGITESSYKEGALLWGRGGQHLRLSFRNSTSIHRPMGAWGFIKLLGERYGSGSPLRELQLLLTLMLRSHSPALRASPLMERKGAIQSTPKSVGILSGLRIILKPDFREALATTRLWDLFCFGRDSWDIWQDLSFQSPLKCSP